MNADNLLFRCSRLGDIMTDPRAKSELLSETCKKYLTEVYIDVKYGRKKDIKNKYIEKGLLVEEDSFTLYSMFKKTMFVKNKDVFKNEFIKGTPDILKNGTVFDIKSSWDIFTFINSKDPKKLNKDYLYQLQGYLALAEKEKAVLAYCLINTPGHLINDEKRKLMWNMNCFNDQDKTYKEACEQLDKNMTYDDIPIDERVIEIEIPRDDGAIQAIYRRVIECRQYMNDTFFKAE